MYVCCIEHTTQNCILLISYIHIYIFAYTRCFFQILTDLVQGEFMQLGSKETENERFAHYLTKTYRKTASLIANTLKAVSEQINGFF